MKMDRRRLLQLAAGFTIGQAALGPRTAFAAPAGTGRVGDFDFLAGSWNVSHRRLKTPGGKDWESFTGEATCFTILGGVGSVEELRVPARKWMGMGLRLLDVEQRIWSDYWVPAASGVLTTPGSMGVFENGVGTFLADDEDGGKPIKVRGVWDRITKTSCRWQQAVSRDAGKTWEDGWFMDWVRA
jgi:hypothetical protein